MDQDHRKASRVNTHIVSEIAVEGQPHNFCGYIENLNKDGVGILSLEKFEPGEEVTLNFFLTGVLFKVVTKATLVHTEKGAYNLYYYGFRFDSLPEKALQAIEQYLGENSLTIPA